MAKSKKIIAVIFSAALIMSLSACKGGIVSTTADVNSTGAGSTATETTAESSAAESSAAESSAAESSAAESSAAESSAEESSAAESSAAESSAAESSAAESSAAESSAAESSAAESSAAESSAAESSATQEGDVKDYIYFDNSKTKWDKVCAYWWNDAYTPVTNKLTEELYPANGENGTQDLRSSWPGIELEKVGDTDIYRCVVPVGAEKIIFNSGVTDADVADGKDGYQTIDLSFADGNAGQIYTIDTSVEPKNGRGIEKTKFKYGEGSWSDYQG